MKIPLQARPRELLRCEKEARTRVREAPEASPAHTARAARPCPDPARAWKAAFRPARRAAAHDSSPAPESRAAAEARSAAAWRIKDRCL